MSAYIEFPVANGKSILVEVDPIEVAVMPAERGESVPAGTGEKIRENLGKARAALEDLLRDAISSSVNALYLAVADIKENKPSEIEMTFALKATGELGNIAVGKLEGEANYSVKVSWKNISKGG